MKHSILKRATILASAALCAGLAQAGEPPAIAAIGDFAGRVMVYNGSVYTPAQTGMALEAGQQVVTLADSRAEVAFHAGCVANLGANGVLSISEAKVCIGGQFMPAPESTTLVYAQDALGDESDNGNEGGTEGGTGGGTGGGMGGTFIAIVATSTLIAGLTDSITSDEKQTAVSGD